MSEPFRLGGFTRFLLSESAVDREDLVRALQHRRKERATLGQLAVQEGLLSQADVERIAAEQHHDPRGGFCEVALELGLINGWKLESLLETHERKKVDVGESLLAIGVISEDRLAALRAKFHELRSVRNQEHHGGRQPSSIGPFGDDRVRDTCLRITSRLLLRIGDLLTEAMPPRLERELPEHAIQVGISLTGDWEGDLILSSDEDIARRIGLRMSGEEDLDPDLVLDAMMEFVNVACNQVIASLEQEGLTVEVSPPTAIDATSRGGFIGRAILCCPLVSGRGTILLSVIPRGSKVLRRASL